MTKKSKRKLLKWCIGSTCGLIGAGAISCTFIYAFVWSHNMDKVDVHYQDTNTIHGLKCLEGFNTAYLVPKPSDVNGTCKISVIGDNGKLVRLVNDRGDEVDGTKSLTGQTFQIILISDNDQGQKIPKQNLKVEVDYGVSHVHINIPLFPVVGQSMAIPAEFLDIQNEVCYGFKRYVSQYAQAGVLNGYDTLIIPEGITEITKESVQPGQEDFVGNGFCNMFDSVVGHLNNIHTIEFPKTLQKIDSTCFVAGTLTDDSPGITNVKICCNTTIDDLMISPSSTLWSKLNNLDIYGTNNYKHIDGDKVCFGFGYVKNVVIENGITSIFGGNNMGFAGAFSGLGKNRADNNMTMVDLPDSLNGIDSGAFKEAKIKNLFFPEHLRSVGNNAFENLITQSVSLNDDLLMIGEEAFKNSTIQSGLIYLPAKVSDIGNHAFYKCTLEKIIVDQNNNYFVAANNVGTNGYVVVDKANGGMLLPDCSNTVGSLAAGEITLTGCGASVTNALAPEAFAGTAIKVLWINDATCVNFGVHSFIDCFQLTKIHTMYSTVSGLVVQGTPTNEVFKGLPDSGVVYYLASNPSGNPLATFKSWGLPTNWTAST